jgi:hypothetical protein
MTTRRNYEFIGEVLDSKDPIDAIWNCLHPIVFHNKENLFPDPAAILSPEALNIYLILSFDFEVQNGGFHQFFYNPTGNFTAKILFALKQAGADFAADLLTRACAEFPMGPPSLDRIARGHELSKLKLDVFSCLDDAYYREVAPSARPSQGSDNLWRFLLDYMRLNSACSIKRNS